MGIGAGAAPPQDSAGPRAGGWLCGAYSLLFGSLLGLVFAFTLNKNSAFGKLPPSPRSVLAVVATRTLHPLAVLQRVGFILQPWCSPAVGLCGLFISGIGDCDVWSFGNSGVCMEQLCCLGL